ncbi:MAG: Branched-chain-amino-acid transaminase 1 [Flavobacteriales bacterium]|jgi:branched-chain amino acid aminotransferase|nr:MAG: branched-chain amino acid aminotransferase [Flavobacteriales bacterium]CAI8257653.1 MAG: Branched-chain-amino-acid transaminase 1 [Flavobacteriales bacterium]|tara:strand:+ start:276 stop:1337 length:1062 start_codon:yes stop_codon:yes gene_type:complete
MKQDIKIIPTKQSSLDAVDFDHLAFGSTFTDHMFVCDYKEGKWETPQIVPFAPMQVSPAASVLHYGQAVFEGMKAFKDEQGCVWLFRPELNAKRINKSAERLAIPTFPEDVFLEGMKKLISLDQNWVKAGLGKSLYVRPFVFASEPGVQASAANEYRFMIICAPVASYYGGDVRVKIADHYSRAPQGGTGYAKAAGNYGGQFYPTQLAKKEGYQQIIWTDAATHEHIEEAGTMNLFFRIGDTLITAPISDSILDGVTRKSILELATHMGIKTEVRLLKVSELIEAKKSGELLEIFGSGTAVVIQPIIGFGYKGNDYETPIPENSYASKLKNALLDIQYNKTEDSFGWRYKVCG